MKILLIGPGMGVDIPPKGWGGIEKVIWKHATNLRSFGHDVTVYNDRDEMQLIYLIKDSNYDVIHCHEAWANQILAKHSIPFCFTSHVSEWMSAWKPHLIFFGNAKLPILFKGMYSNYSGPSRLLWNGADEEFFYPEQKQKRLCIAVGKNQPRKKFDEIAALFMNKPNHELYIIGPGNGKYSDLVPNIHGMENVSEEKVAEYMRRAEYLFHLSDIEADALVVREGALAGCKLILSRYCSATIGKNFCWEDYENFEKCPEDFGRKAYEAAIHNGTWKAVAKQLEQYYFEYLQMTEKEGVKP